MELTQQFGRYVVTDFHILKTQVGSIIQKQTAVSILVVIMCSIMQCRIFGSSSRFRCPPVEMHFLHTSDFILFELREVKYSSPIQQNRCFGCSLQQYTKIKVLILETERNTEHQLRTTRISHCRTVFIVNHPVTVQIFINHISRNQLSPRLVTNLVQTVGLFLIGYKMIEYVDEVFIQSLASLLTPGILTGNFRFILQTVAGESQVRTDIVTEIFSDLIVPAQFDIHTTVAHFTQILQSCIFTYNVRISHDTIPIHIRNNVKAIFVKCVYSQCQTLIQGGKVNTDIQFTGFLPSQIRISQIAFGSTAYIRTKVITEIITTATTVESQIWETAADIVTTYQTIGGSYFQEINPGSLFHKFLFRDYPTD